MSHSLRKRITRLAARRYQSETTQPIVLFYDGADLASRADAEEQAATLSATAPTPSVIFLMPRPERRPDDAE